MQRATKKACGSLDTMLTPEFIDRAMESNPVELLNNKALMLECLFSSEPRLEFKAYHDPYSATHALQTIRDHTKSGVSTIKSERNLALAYSLREDIPLEDILYFARHIKNKKLLSHVVKVHPELLDWELLKILISKDIGLWAGTTFPIFKKIWCESGGEDSAVILDFYSRLVPRDQFYAAFLDSIHHEKYKKHARRASPKVVKLAMPHLLKEDTAPQLLWDLAKCWGANKGYDITELSTIVYGHIRCSSSPYPTITEAKEFIKMYKVVLSQQFYFRNSIKKVLANTIMRGNRKIFFDAITELLDEEYGEPLCRRTYAEATSMNGSWNWLEDNWFKGFGYRIIASPTPPGVR